MQRSKSSRPKKYAWRWQRLYKILMNLLYAGVLTLIIAIPMCLSMEMGLILFVIILSLLCLNLLAVLALHWEREKVLRNKAATLTLNDLLFLIDTWRFDSASRRNKILTKLPRILLESETDDFDLLNTAHRLFLNKALLGYDTELVTAVLTAWERAGDSRAIPFVEKLAAGRASAVGNPGIQQQAQECLIILQERAALVQNADTLLRASTAATTPDILLRPAYTAPQSAEAEAQLLRATTEKEDNPTP